VRFLWPIADDAWAVARPQAELLMSEARHLHALGLGIDLVAGNGRILSDSERAALRGEIWVGEEGGVGWRVPVVGSLDELSARHVRAATRVAAAGDRRTSRWVTTPSPPVVWREVGYRRRALGRERTAHAFALAGAEDELLSFDPRRVVEVAAWLRHAAHISAKALKLDAPFVEGFVCGHGEDETEKNSRFSYLPLPTLTPKGRDGRIRRALIAEPFGGSGDKALAVARRLRGAALVEEGTGEIMAELRAVAPADGVFRRYLPKDGALTWGTVTPIVLPGRDDRRSRKAVGLVLKALAQAGYTTPVTEVTLQAAPVFPGQEMAAGYRLPEYLKPFPRTHVIVTFAEPMPGPVAIGGGRHIGLGLMATVQA
jgi:CRISPR-associated protein Csb2